MLIEADARRFITEAIEVEKTLSSLEEREKIKGKILVDNEEYHKCRQKLTKIIC